MNLATLSINSRIAFNKAAVMAWVYREGRFAFRMCRTLSARRPNVCVMFASQFRASGARRRLLPSTALLPRRRRPARGLPPISTSCSANMSCSSPSTSRCSALPPFPSEAEP